MGKNGPCQHCGVTSTPLWRNGPPEKPILCNACGSRWRTKGSLVNYTPLHAREPIQWEEPKVSKLHSICLKTKEPKIRKRKQIYGTVESEHRTPFSEPEQNFIKTLEGDASNRSSSGSVVSYSGSCAHVGAPDTSDWTGSPQSNVWDSLAPSKKRTIIHEKPYPFEKLTKELYSIWNEQQSTNQSGSSDEDLLYQDEASICSAEIGHGVFLLRNPCSKTVEEESEAISLPIDNKLISEARSRSASFPDSESKKYNRFLLENINLLLDKDSLPRSTNLKDIEHKLVTGVNEVENGTNFLRNPGLAPMKLPSESKNQKFQDSWGNTRSPKTACTSSCTNLSSTKSPLLVPSEAGSEEILDAEEETCLSPRSLFASPRNQSSMFGSTAEISDQDPLLDVRCSASFPETQLLCHHP